MLWSWSRRHPVVAVLVGGVGAVSLVVAVAALSPGVGGDEPTAFERARQLAADEDSFDTGLEAGETLARISDQLNTAIEDCRSATPGSTRCQALGSASGYAQVLATVVLTCTSPGRVEARARMTRYLDAVAEVVHDDGRVPAPPRLPRC